MPILKEVRFALCVCLGVLAVYCLAYIIAHVSIALGI